MRPMKAEILPGIILVMGIAAVLVADPGSVPPSTPMVAALVAARCARCAKRWDSRSRRGGLVAPGPVCQ